jgi:hypothetical protein
MILIKLFDKRKQDLRKLFSFLNYQNLVLLFFSYKKQSSGKDLSSRSHNDLDSIFGWNKLSINNQIKEQEDNQVKLRILTIILFTFF